MIDMHAGTGDVQALWTSAMLNTIRTRHVLKATSRTLSALLRYFDDICVDDESQPVET